MLSKTNKPLSYSRARELLLNAISDVGLDKKKFGLHSLRSGVASQAAHNCIPERLLKSHGRWKSDIAKDGYIKENLNNKLSLSQNLNLLTHIHEFYLCYVELFGVHLNPYKSLLFH